MQRHIWRNKAERVKFSSFGRDEEHAEHRLESRSPTNVFIRLKKGEMDVIRGPCAAAQSGGAVRLPVSLPFDCGLSSPLYGFATDAACVGYCETRR